MEKLTKIIATIGPSCDSEELIESMINSGVNIFRFNFKHNTVEWHEERIRRVNAIADRLGKPVGTLIDLQGPEIRINIPESVGTEVGVAKGDLLHIDVEDKPEHGKRLTITHPEVLKHLSPGQKVVIDDGAFLFYVEEVGAQCVLRSESDGVITDRKSMNIPGADFPFPVLIDRDYEGLKLASSLHVDYVALSFVRSAQDLKILKQEMNKHGVNALVVSKIEAQKALENLDEIIHESGAVMVARGDLGVELPKEQVPYYQKIIIKKSVELGIPVITATQMLQSMVSNPYPTRAEISDVANAAYDLTDAIMLSGETALGQYPLEAVTTMAQTVSYNETKFPIDTRSRFNYNIDEQASMICNAAYALYLQFLKREEEFAGFVVFTQSGRTARLLSRYRSEVPIYTFTPNSSVRDGLTINFAVQPFERPIPENQQVTNDEIIKALQFLKENYYVQENQKVIVLHGDVWAQEGGTSTIKILST
ncbi:MAG: pyruvate kinase [Patescibacteria group bacterium]